MKTILFLYLFITLSVLCTSQDLEPSQLRFNFRGVQQYLSADSSYFTQDSFLLGWHWGASKRISEAELCNQHDQLHLTGTSDDLSDSSGVDILLKPNGYTHALGPDLLCVRAMQYEPTLLLDPNHPETFVLRQGDTTRPVFGFLHRRGRVITNQNDPNFNRLIIDGDSVTALANEVILDKAWLQNALNMNGKNYWIKQGNSGLHVLDTSLCRTLYISINLRSLDASAGNEGVLKIEMPYTLYQASGGLIKFDSIPHTNPESTVVFNNRGRFRKLEETDRNQPAPTSFTITKNMLPANGEDITISGFFRCNGLFARHNWELFSGNLNDDLGKIDSLGIKITYLGNAPIAIDWVRIETPHARRFLRGDFDTELQTQIQQELTKYSAADYVNNDYRLLRFNTVVEGGVQNWIADHYFSKLIGNIITGETGPIYPKHYEHYVNAPDR